MEDAPRPGQAHRIVTDENIALVEELVKENKHISSGHNIVYNVLHFNKVSASHLTAKLRDRRIDVCQELLHRFHAEGDAFLRKIVTGDETWIHYNQPETKRSSKQWRHSSSPKPKKNPHSTVCWKSHAHSLLGCKWSHFGALHE